MAKGSGTNAMALLLKAVEGGLGGLNAARQESKQDAMARQQRASQQVGMALNVLDAERRSNLANQQMQLENKRFDALTKHQDEMQKYKEQEINLRRIMLSQDQQYKKGLIQIREDEVNKPKAPTGAAGTINYLVTKGGMTTDQAIDKLYPKKGPVSSSKIADFNHLRSLNIPQDEAIERIWGSSTGMGKPNRLALNNIPDIENQIAQEFLSPNKFGDTGEGAKTVLQKLLSDKPTSWFGFFSQPEEDQALLGALERAVTVRGEMETLYPEFKGMSIPFFNSESTRQAFNERFQKMLDRNPEEQANKLQAYHLYNQLATGQSSGAAGGGAASVNANATSTVLGGILHNESLQNRSSLHKQRWAQKSNYRIGDNPLLPQPSGLMR